MYYAVVGYFDARSDARIRALWQGLADAGADDYLIRSANSPHVKFTVYDSLDIAEAERILSELCNLNKRFDIRFKSYNFYPKDKPSVCIDIAASFPLLQMQSDIQNVCGKFGHSDDRVCTEAEVWKFECPLTRGIDKANLMKAVEYLRDTELPFAGTVERLGIIEWPPARQLFSFALA